MSNSPRIIIGDCRDVLPTLPDQSVHCCVTSPPYFGLRDYGVDGQIGLEPTPDDFVGEMVKVFREVRRVLREDGTLWLNLGDSYATGTTAGRQQSPNPGVGANNPDAQNSVARIGTPDGLKTKDLIGIPWRVAFALQADGWYLRQDIIWAKPNPMPESVTDRCTKSHEYIFMLSKSARYYYDSDAIKEPAIYAELGYKDAETYAGKHHKTDKQRGHSRRHAGFSDRWDSMSREEQCSGTRNKRDVWTVATKPFPDAHFATFPPKLIEPCILAGCPIGGTVLDPFNGAGTTGLVSVKHGRKYIGVELNPEYAAMAEKRIARHMDGTLEYGAAS